MSSIREEQAIQRIREIAAQPTAGESSDNFYPGDSGNHDDTYADGERDGQIGLARLLVGYIDGTETNLPPVPEREPDEPDDSDDDDDDADDLEDDEDDADEGDDE